jgi:hypothetical protein
MQRTGLLASSALSLAGDAKIIEKANIPLMD